MWSGLAYGVTQCPNTTIFVLLCFHIRQLINATKTEKGLLCTAAAPELQESHLTYHITRVRRVGGGFVVKVKRKGPVWKCFGYKPNENKE